MRHPTLKSLLTFMLMVPLLAVPAVVTAERIQADLIGYESELNRIMSNFPQVNLCLYDLTRCSGDLIMDVLKTHPKALLGGMVIDNPYYLDPDEFLASRA